MPEFESVFDAGGGGENTRSRVAEEESGCEHPKALRENEEKGQRGEGESQFEEGKNVREGNQLEVGKRGVAQEVGKRGPRIVTVGGGHGLATLLRGLKVHTRNLTAVVTVGDDGGSSGRLRESHGILPPGDIRNCLAALSNDEAMLTQLFQYRFSGSAGLEGHSFGNLFITAMADITGSFEEAVAESGRVLSVNGRVLPSTLHDVKLVASMELPHSLNEIRVEGESKIPTMAGRVRRVWLEPDDAPAFPPVIKAILNADVIVVGPGRLYTSLTNAS